MTHSELYNQITALPLLQGISAEHILQMKERGALRIVSMEPEEGNVIHAGQRCNTLTMLMEGTLLCTTEGEGWVMTEELHAPAIIEEDALWSLSQKYTHTYTPKKEGKLLVIDRNHVTHIMMHNDVFRINLLTRMSTRIERLNTFIQVRQAESIAHKIERFAQSISHTPCMPKHLSIKMTTLAKIVGETRLRVSQTLHRMQQEGMLSLTREQITFHQFKLQ